MTQCRQGLPLPAAQIPYSDSVGGQYFAACITYKKQRLCVTAEACSACLAGRSSCESAGCELETFLSSQLAKTNKATRPREATRAMENRKQGLLAASAVQC